MTREQLLDLPQHLATLRDPVFADEVWLVPVKDETVVIAVNVNHSPSHVIAAYAGILDVQMFRDLFHIATEQVGRTSVMRMWLPHGKLQVMNSGYITTIAAFRES